MNLRTEEDKHVARYSVFDKPQHVRHDVILKRPAFIWDVGTVASVYDVVETTIRCESMCQESDIHCELYEAPRRNEGLTLQIAPHPLRVRDASIQWTLLAIVVDPDLGNSRNSKRLS